MWRVPEIGIKLNHGGVEMARRGMSSGIRCSFCEVALVSGPVRGEKRGETGWLPVSAFILWIPLEQQRPPPCDGYETYQ
jgi:hypothetical protein